MYWGSGGAGERESMRCPKALTTNKKRNQPWGIFKSRSYSRPHLKPKAGYTFLEGLGIPRGQCQDNTGESSSRVWWKSRFVHFAQR